jgi:quinol monooxygenase YgiN
MSGGAGIGEAARSHRHVWIDRQVDRRVGKRDELMTILIEGTRDMPACSVTSWAKDAVDENVIWVTEDWDSQASRDASLTLPAVKNCIAQGKPLSRDSGRLQRRVLWAALGCQRNPAAEDARGPRRSVG